MQIQFRGTKDTNQSSREGHKPCAIVNHITGGTASSAHFWFTDPDNAASSAHFIVTKTGQIWQYVDLAKKAWANGISGDAFSKVTSSLVKSKGRVNPNNYTISIEHEGVDGSLTEAQFQATIWLHKHLRSEVGRLFGVDLPLDRKHVIGHYEIDPKRKPYCPGPKFPWERLIKALNDGSAHKPAEVVDDPTPTLRRGDKDGAVYVLQQALTKAGYPTNADGSFGEMTYRAVLAFQENNGLGKDGIVGPKTWEALNKAITPNKPKNPAPIPKEHPCTVVVNGQETRTKGKVLDDGHSYIPVRDVANILGYCVGWNQTSKVVTVNGNALNNVRIYNDVSYIWSRSFCDLFHLGLEWDNANRTVKIFEV